MAAALYLDLGRPRPVAAGSRRSGGGPQRAPAERRATCMAGVSMYTSSREIRASRTVHTWTMARSNADPPLRVRPRVRPTAATWSPASMKRSMVTVESIASQHPLEELPRAVVPPDSARPRARAPSGGISTSAWSRASTAARVPPRERVVDLPDERQARGGHGATPSASRQRHAGLLPVVEEALEADVGQRVLDELLEDGEREGRHVRARRAPRRRRGAGSGGTPRGSASRSRSCRRSSGSSGSGPSRRARCRRAGRGTG